MAWLSCPVYILITIQYYILCSFQLAIKFEITRKYVDIAVYIAVYIYVYSSSPFSSHTCLISNPLYVYSPFDQVYTSTTLWRCPPFPLFHPRPFGAAISVARHHTCLWCVPLLCLPHRTVFVLSRDNDNARIYLDQTVVLCLFNWYNTYIY